MVCTLNNIIIGSLFLQFAPFYGQLQSPPLQGLECNDNMELTRAENGIKSSMSERKVH